MQMWKKEWPHEYGDLLSARYTWQSQSVTIVAVTLWPKENKSETIYERWVNVRLSVALKIFIVDYKPFNLFESLGDVTRHEIRELSKPFN